MNDINIRKALEKDISRLKDLLSEVLELHAQIRPDIFIHGTTKYTDDEIKRIISNPLTPVFVACNNNDYVLGYVFCVIKSQPFSTNMKDFKSLFIDDLCVDKTAQGMHIGRKLFNYALDYASKEGCYDVTLNVWEGNENAKAFYKKMGMFVKETQMEIILNKNK